MAARQRGVKRSIDASGSTSFVFAPNVDLNATTNLAAPAPPLGLSGNVDNSGSDAFPAHPVSNIADTAPSVSQGAASPAVKKSDRRHRCDLCGKLFNRPSSLKIHLTTHTGERPFPCPYPGCGRAFNVSSNMRRHFRTHNSEGQGGSTAPASASDFSTQEHQTQPQTQTWNVNIYDPSGGSQAPRPRTKRSKTTDANNPNGRDGDASEGADTDNGRQATGPHQNVHPYPPIGPPGAYPGFPPAPFMNIPGLPGMPDMPGIPDMHSLQGVPMGVQMMPIEMAFPVDPALTGQNAEGDADADADGEGDEDGDEDGDGENDGDGDGGESEATNRPQLTHSTSNTRASTNASSETKTRMSARVQAKAKATSTGTRGRGRPPKTGNASQGSSQQQQVQFRQILVPVSVPLSGDPAQAARIAQQYQQQYAQYAKYAQYAQYYMQQQQAAQAQVQTTIGQVAPHQAPHPPPSGQQAIATGTSVQRPGPATSAERTTPVGASQSSSSNATSGETAGRSVFVHWGPKTDSSVKEARERAVTQPLDQSAMATLAESAANLSEAAKAEGNVSSTSEKQNLDDGHVIRADTKKGQPSSTDATNEAVGTVDEGEELPRDPAGEASSPAGVGDGVAEVEVDEAGGAEASDKLGSPPTSPRKRGRKPGRARGRGRR